jgi:hypothetical protein
MTPSQVLGVMHTSAEIRTAEFIKTEVSDDAIQAYFKEVWSPFLTDILRVLTALLVLYCKMDQDEWLLS